MSSAVELVLIFIGLEISSISSYVLVGFRRREATSSEASLSIFFLDRSPRRFSCMAWL